MERLSVIKRPLAAYAREFDASEIAQALPFPKLIRDLSTALSRLPAAPLRLRLHGVGQRELLVMPAMSENFAGVKILTVNPDNSSNGLPVIGGTYVLLDNQTGIVSAMMDAGELTARRTAALSALASSRLSRIDSETLCILGTGHLAPYLAEAHCTVRPIRKVAIWGRDDAKMQASCIAVQDRLPGIEVRPVDDLANAVSQSDIVSAATRAQDPLICGDWLTPGTHVDLVGGYRPDMREIDDTGIANATIYVDTLEAALSEAGDLRSPIERGIISQDNILGDIAALLSGAGRVGESQITLFKSVGSATWDLAAAELVWLACGG